ncbi:hypothetical protein BDQ17DRAFT_1328041 [Cyathus striatus]|nr:hypothetical protein BDQ17DRAFT_1328041 [Cyathus striatus]
MPRSDGIRVCGITADYGDARYDLQQIKTVEMRKLGYPSARYKISDGISFAESRDVRAQRNVISFLDDGELDGGLISVDLHSIGVVQYGGNLEGLDGWVGTSCDLQVFSPIPGVPLFVSRDMETFRCILEGIAPLECSENFEQQAEESISCPSSQ